MCEGILHTADTPRGQTMAGAVSLLAFGLGCLLLVGCVQGFRSEYPVVPEVQEVDMQWKPVQGMRLVILVRTSVALSGAGARSLPEGQRTLVSSHSRIIEITAVTPDYFEFRGGEHGVRIPATVRLSRQFAFLGFTLDESAPLTDHERAALRNPATIEALRNNIQGPLKAAGQFYRRWRIGDSNPYEFVLAGAPGTAARVNVMGSATLRRVVVIGDRLAASFDCEGRGAMQLASSTGDMAFAGQYWQDVATGVMLRTRAIASATVATHGGPMSMRIEMEEELDLGSSKL